MSANPTLTDDKQGMTPAKFGGYNAMVDVLLEGGDEKWKTNADDEIMMMATTAALLQQKQQSNKDNDEYCYEVYCLKKPQR